MAGSALEAHQGVAAFVREHQIEDASELTTAWSGDI